MSVTEPRSADDGGAPLAARRPPVGPAALVAAVCEHGSLIWQLARREFSGRYRGSFVGLGWAVLSPILMLAIYTFVFSVVFGLRWEGPVTDRTGFAVAVYAGMIVHGFFAECMTRAPQLIVDNRNLVKKVVFPLQILPWTVLLVAAFHLLVGVAVIAAALVVKNGALPWSAVALPAILLPLALLALGVVYAFSALGVYLRDLGHLVGFFSLVLLFLSPVFYPAAAVPADWRWVIAWNPIAEFIEMTRGCLVYGTWPAPLRLLGIWMLALAGAWLGFYWFQRTRRGFADVL